MLKKIEKVGYVDPEKWFYNHLDFGKRPARNIAQDVGYRFEVELQWEEIRALSELDEYIGPFVMYACAHHSSIRIAAFKNENDAIRARLMVG